MIKEFPLELLIRILSPLDVKNLIRLRAVNKRWRIVIDQYLLVELTLFREIYPSQPVRSVFLKRTRTNTSLKRTILCLTGRFQKKVYLDKIRFLFRNVRTLTLIERMGNSEPMDEFISKYLLEEFRWIPLLIPLLPLINNDFS